MTHLSIRWQPSPRHPRHLEVYIDEDLWRLVDRGMLEKALKAAASKATSWADFHKLFAERELESARRYALSLLAMRSYLTDKLKKKMEDKLFDSHAIDHALSYCQERGYLDDAAVLATMIASFEKRGYGSRAIAMKIGSLPISLEMQKRALCEMQDNERQSQALESLIEKYRGKYNFCDFAQRQKALAALMRRGFAYDDIQKHLSM